MGVVKQERLGRKRGQPKKPKGKKKKIRQKSHLVSPEVKEGKSEKPWCEA